MVKLHIIDFCGTLVNVQTADRFIQNIVKRDKIKHIKYNFFRLLRKIIKTIKMKKFFSLKMDKTIYLSLIKNKSQEEIERYAEIFVDFLYKNHLNKKIEDLLLSSINGTDKVIVLSAGYYEYIKKFNFKYRVDQVIASELIFDKDYFFTGKINRTVYANDKVKVLDEIGFLEDGKKYQIIVYTDSFSDMPLLELADLRYCINPDKKLYKIAKERNWEIIYDKS